MIKAMLKLLALPWRRKNDKTEHLYYLYGIKPIKPNKYVMDECTVGRG